MNIIWIVSLVISLTAALLATLIRQWSRDRMRLFQRYNTPLEVARIRQYLHEGTIRTRIAALAEAVPLLVHISLFLFLAGLGDFLWNSYKTVGKSTLFSIVLCAALYIIITFAPIMNPQSSYRTPCSPLVWYVTRKLQLGSSMAEGQMQLAMKNDDARKHRDAEAIRWLVNSLTSNEQDLESLALRIPGSFDTMWGVQVWRDALRGEAVKLHRDIRYLFESCGDRGSFISDNDWRVRSRACTGAMGVFVFFMDADIAMIRNLGELLSNIGGYGGTREMAELSSNQSFAIYWTCLSLLSIQKSLDSPQWGAHTPRQKFVTFKEKGGSDIHENEMALRNARTMDAQFAAACGHVGRLRDIRKDLYNQEQEDQLEEKIKEILSEYKPELEPIVDQVTRLEDIGMDESLSELQHQIDKLTHSLIRKLPGVEFDDDDDITAPITVEQVLDLLVNPVRPQFIRFSRLLRGLCGINKKWRDKLPQDIDKALQSIEDMPLSLSQRRFMERQLWRVLDLYNGSFGFTLELYFLSIGKLLSTFSRESPRGFHHTVFVKTFKVITSGWKTTRYSPGTRQIIFHIIIDIAFQGCGTFSGVAYPNYITNELLDLLSQVIGGAADKYTEDARREIHEEYLTPSTMVDPQFLPRARAIFGPPGPAPAPVPGPTQGPDPGPAPGPSHGPEPAPAPGPALAPVHP